ncbi:flexible cuticle protein 12 [Anabrus simplex]|uniref:flexible cuticle protein 12 n=1 Tax=Anabrus simplex TaxID=316456 RepID=UPI0035A38926
MKLLLVIAAVLALSAAAPQTNYKDAVILEQSNDNVGFGPWSWNYRTSDGKTHQESGTINNVGTENEAIAVRGSYSWVAPSGETYTITYVADENGFQPQGAHIPGRK